MARQYMTLETAAIAAVDTEYAMVSLGVVAAETRQVESGKSRIRRAWVLLTADGAALGAGVGWIRLSGPGINQSEVKLPLGGYGGSLVTTGGQQAQLFELNDLDIAVKGGSNIDVNAQVNLDIGTCSALVCLEIE
ncbi:hypothetical protein KAX17_11085 [Candidatus Bipolaricaulota bacterium]|nr:hypothetical protein [Candidatus Bipolaricaulota bacterium]MCK4599235.1 hypothetical protein [Candidatus Bipolaricaulota bacterium]